MGIATLTNSGAQASALFVTFLWSTSFIIVKNGVSQLPPLFFAGLRYTIGGLCLLIFWKLTGDRLRKEDKPFGALSVLITGVVQFTLTQGALFIALGSFPAQVTSLALSTTPVFVGLMDWLILGRRFSKRFRTGITILVSGAGIYLLPFSLPSGVPTIAIVAVIAVPILNAIATVVSWQMNQNRNSLTVTTLSMLTGEVVLLLSAAIFESDASFSSISAFRLMRLAIVNTAFAFALWNTTLKTISATSASVLNNTMLLQIGVLSWMFLGEALSAVEISGLLLVMIGATIVAKDRAKTRVQVDWLQSNSK